jgi:hypothetical protein
MRGGWIIYIVATLVLVGIAVLYRSREGFESATPPPNMDLGKTLQRVQGLLDRFATPDMIAHIGSVAGKDPGELARMYASSQQKKEGSE